MNEQLAQQHITANQRLQALAAQGVARAWEQRPSYNEADIAPFLAIVVPFVLAAQRQIAALTNAYLGRQVGRAPLPLHVTRVSGASVRNGATPDEVYRRPFVTVWTALKAGTAWEDAVHAGLERATGTAAMDVQLSMRQTLVEVGEADPRIVGYQRVPDGGACEFCVLVAGQRYTTADLMPVHNRCGCGVDVITDDDRHLFSGKLENDLSEGVAVHEHGELGPVLGDPAHDFTSLA